MPPGGWPSVPPGDWPGMPKGGLPKSNVDLPKDNNIDHINAPKGKAGPEDWKGESEIDKLKPGSVGFEGNYHQDEEPEEWNDFYHIERLVVRIYAKSEQDVCRLRDQITQVVYDGKLTDGLESWGLDNFDVGLIEETKGYDASHTCACNCQSECGALPLPPCAPQVEVDGEYVGPSYWRAHLHQVTFHLREFDSDSKEELESGEAHAVYTTDETDRKSVV